MDTTFWLDRWQEGKIGFHQSHINPALKKHWSALGLTSADRVLVPLCGKSLDMIHLSSLHPVTGVELSPLAVKDFIQENQLVLEQTSHPHFEIQQNDSLQIFCGDFFNLQQDELPGLKGIYDRAALIAFPPELRQAYAKKIAQLLPPRGKILLVTFVYPQEERNGPPFSVSALEVTKLFSKNFKIDLIDSVDILNENSKYKDWGLTAAQEEIFILTRSDIK